MLLIEPHFISSCSHYTDLFRQPQASGFFQHSLHIHGPQKDIGNSYSKCSYTQVMIKGVTDMEYGPCVRASSRLKSDSQRWATLQNAH